MLEIVETLIEHLRPLVEFHPVSDFHISLSKTFVVLHHWIEPLVQDLKKNLAECKRCVCVIMLYVAPLSGTFEAVTSRDIQKGQAYVN